MIDVGVMVLAHSRPWLLSAICKQVRTAWPDSVIQIAADRPIMAVQAALAQPMGAQILEVPFPVVADREYYMEARRWQLDQLRPYRPRYAVLWDDDHLVEDTLELTRAMQAGHDLIYMDKAYFWDSFDNVNTAIPLHRSVFFFKVREGDQFPLDRFIHAPAGVHDDPTARRVCMQGRLLDVGYIDAAERTALFKKYARAGKIDQVTCSLVETPQYEKFVPVNPRAAAIHKELKCLLSARTH